MSINRLVVLTCLLLLATACGLAPLYAQTKQVAPTTGATPKAVLREHPYALLNTNLGDILIELWPEVAPRHVAQISKLIRMGAYNGVYFFRVEPGFVVQLDDVRRRGVGFSAAQLSAIKKIPAEFTTIPHTRGILSMARQNNDPNSAETSFSILLGNAPHLDGQYTVWGRVVRGDAVLQRMEHVPVDANSSPKKDVPIVLTDARMLTRHEAESITLELPILPPGYGIVDGGPDRSNQITIALAIVTLLCAVGTVLSASRRNLTLVNSFAMATALSAFFLIFVAVVGRQMVSGQMGHQKQIMTQAWATFGFVGALILFKLLSRFEIGGESKSKPASVTLAPTTVATVLPLAALNEQEQQEQGRVSGEGVEQDGVGQSARPLVHNG